MKTIETREDIQFFQQCIKASKSDSIVFDLDGTLISKNMSFPYQEINAISEKFTTYLSTGSSPIATGIKTSKDLANYFSGNLIFNTSQIFDTSVSLDNPSSNSLLHEYPINPEEIKYLVKILATFQQKIDYIYFYPGYTNQVDTNQYKPNAYVYSIANTSRSSEIKANLEAKLIKSESTQITDFHNFLEILARTGCTKVTISKNDSERLFAHSLKEQLSDINLIGSNNTDYFDITKLSKLDLFRKAQLLSNKKDTNFIMFGNDYNDLDSLIASKVGILVDSNKPKTKALKMELTTRKVENNIFIASEKVLKELLQSLYP